MPPLTARERLLLRLSNLFFALTGLVIVVYLAVFIKPDLIPSALRPPTVIPSATSLPTSTPTASPSATSIFPNLPTAWTDTPPSPRTATPTFHLKPTEDISPTPRQSRTPTPTLTKTRIPTTSPYYYTLQTDYPIYSAYPGGCKWLGFAGEVLDSKGQRVVDLVIHIGGPDYLVLSGSSQEYGIKGWVQKVSSQPANTTSAYTIQVLDTIGNPLSSVIPVPTFKDCTKNLATINFVQNH